MKVGPCISALPGSSDSKACTMLRARDGAGQRQGPAGQRLAEGHDVRRHARLLEGEHRPGPPEAGEDLVEDQRQPMPVAPPRAGGPAPPAHGRPCRRRPGPAAPPRSPASLAPCRSSAASSAADDASSRGRSQMSCVGHRALEQGVHPLLRIAHRHGRESVAVIAAPERQEARAPPRRPGSARTAGPSSWPLPPPPSRTRRRTPARRTSRAGAHSRSASRSAGSCTSPPSITCGMASS